MSKFKFGAFIGRFQPIHNGHVYAIKVAASQVDTLLILVGSANACRSIKNPWTYQERINMMRKRLFQDGVTNVEFYPVNDHPYNDNMWVAEVVSCVQSRYDGDDFALFGHYKEGNSYLKLFPQWKFVSLPSGGNVCATDVRSAMFTSNSPDIPTTVMDDYRYYEEEAKKFSNYPFPETLNFNCADSVVTCAGHILIIQRKHTPGRGSWALPGGFKNRNETFLDCALRELREETGLRVPEKVLRGSIAGSKMFDSPNRSFGINRNTYAFWFNIEPNHDGSLPRITKTGLDDAARAEWVPTSNALQYSFFDDHSGIISDLTGMYPQYAFKYV